MSVMIVRNNLSPKNLSPTTNGFIQEKNHICGNLPYCNLVIK